MESQLDTKRKCFTFIWILENFEYCREKKGEQLHSPSFIVDTIDRTKWSLSIYPRGEDSKNWISLYLNRKADSKGPDTIEIGYELSFLAWDGSVLTAENQHKYAFSKGEGYGFPEFEVREYVFSNQLMCLPQGALTIRCRMFKCIGEVKEDGQAIARTRIGVERNTFLWKIHNFSTLDVGREITFRLKSKSDDKLIMFLHLLLYKSRNSHALLIKFVRINKSIVYSKFKSSLVDSNCAYVDCGQYETWFKRFNKKHTLSISKEMMMDNKSLYLPNDTLTLRCEQGFSTGIAYEKIESTSYECMYPFITNNTVSENMKSFSIGKSESDASSDLESNLDDSWMDLNIETYSVEKSDLKAFYGFKMDLNSMLQDNILCDVNLVTESETFPAHWLILSVRSPVFSDMFKSDMKEKATDRIEIKDLKPDTVRHMLQYMYTDSLGELHWDDASDLYAAAEKYQIMSLKHKCSTFLMSNLNFTNACQLLIFADLHQDEELKSTVQNFILKNGKSIINSDDWKLLMDANVQLAAETLVLRYKEDA